MNHEPRTLRSRLPWKDLYPELPTVAAARQKVDPVFWFKTKEEPRGRVMFYVAGYSVYGLPEPFVGRTGGSLSIVSLGHFLRGYDMRFYGLMVHSFDKTMRWSEIGGEYLEYEGPGWIEYCLDESWQATRLSGGLERAP